MICERGSCMKLWYKNQASGFTEALPLGNGSLGAMVYGQMPDGHMTLNLDTLWSGTGTRHEKAPEEGMLQKVRELIYKGEYYEAEKLIEKNMLGFFTESYMPMANFSYFIKQCSPIYDYRRELDLETGCAEVWCRTEKGCFKLNGFASFPHRMLVFRFEHTGTEKLEMELELDSLLHSRAEAGNSCIRLRGMAPSHVEPNYVECENAVQYREDDPGLLFVTELFVQDTDGTVEKKENRLRIKEASFVTVGISAVCGYTGYEKAQIRDFDTLEESLNKRKASVLKKSYEALLKEHMQDYQMLYSRVSLEIGDQKENIPTDERLAAIRKGMEDPGLYSLFFQYGRYLLISSSRPGSQAANLQGIWNEELRPAWSSNYTTNINTQMNYWAACGVNLAECQEPLHRLLQEMSIRGRETAEKQYSCRGWAANHNVDLWRQTNPVGGLPKYAYWPVGGIWMASHLFTYYEYTQDVEFLKNTAYPILEGCVLFVQDFLTEGPDGRLHTCPSTSPENVFYDDKGRICSVSYSSTMDISLIRELLQSYLSMAEIIPTDENLKKNAKEMLSRIPEIQIGPDGCIQEWIHPFAEVELGHRHLTPLYGVHPGNQITPENTPKLSKASLKLLNKRLTYGGGHTGWSCAWLISLFARLEDRKSAEKYLKHLLTDSVYDNLFDLHPPLNEGFEGEKEVFQIDGNFGAVEGILNMLLQSRQEEVYLLPALPEMWKNGKVQGLCAKGGFEVDIMWKDHQLIEAVICSKNENDMKIRCNCDFIIINEKTGVCLERSEGGTAIAKTESSGRYKIQRIK